MKGFVYLLEIAVASILITVVLGTFFAIRIKESWQRSDLIAAGNNILNYLKYNESFLINILNGNLSDIDRVKSGNIKYGLEIVGSPKSMIRVGCVERCGYVKNELLSPVYVNNRWINFSVQEFDIDEFETIPFYFDAVILLNFTDYSSQRQKIEDYLDDGGMVIGINATFNNNDPDFNEVFDLNGVVSASSDLKFSPYDPSQDKIAKYFLGFGFDASSSWWIWENEWAVDYTPTYVNISKVGAIPPENRTFLNEGEVFDLPGPDSDYHFKVKRISYPERVEFQSLNTSFTFIDFSENNVKGNNFNVLRDSGSNFAGLTTNNSAVWTSDFIYSDEYRTLVKAAIASKTDDWVAKTLVTEKDTVTVSSFMSLCCDMPELLELKLSLAYIL